MRVHDATEERHVAAIEGEILAQAEARAAEIVERAGRIADRIIKSAERKAEEIRREAAERLAPRLRAERARALALVELEVRREEVVRREALVDQAFAEARTVLSAWRRRPDADAILARLIAGAVESLQGSRFKVELAPEDADRWAREGLVARLEQELSARLLRPIALEVVRSPDRFSGGARVISEDGRAMVDETFEARLDRMAGDLRRDVVRAVFAPGAREEPLR